MKTITEPQLAAALSLSVSQFRTSGPHGLPYTRIELVKRGVGHFEGVRHFDLEATRTWMREHKPSALAVLSALPTRATRPKPPAAPARKPNTMKTHTPSLAALRAQIDRNGRDLDRLIRKPSPAADQRGHDRLALAIAMGTATSTPAVVELHGGTVLELGVRYALPPAARDTRPTDEPPARRVPRLPPSEKAVLDAAMGLHDTALVARDDGNKLILGATAPVPSSRA